VDIINPNFIINNENNIFNIRKKEYENIEVTVREMLRAAEELGFTIMEFGIKDSKSSAGELNKTVRRNLVIRLHRGTAEVDLSVFIPKLIEDNYIVIGGRKKIPLFQLFDIPIVTRGKTIKLRTNVATIMIEESKEFPYVRISAFGKSVPLVIVMLANFGLEEIERMFNLSSMVPIEKPESLYDKFLNELKDFYDSSTGCTRDDFLKEIGRHIGPNQDHKTKGDDFVFSLNLIHKVDIVTAKFLKTGNVLEELVDAMKNIDSFDDTDIRNKRVRCFEYAILQKVAKSIFDLCVSNRSSRFIKFNVNSKQILSDCNVSDIVQFDFSINPLEELTKLSRLSILGPGGFNRDNVPKYLRDIMPTMFGRICPVDTPDRDNCGILQNLLPNVKIDENLKFIDEIQEKQSISIPVSMVPFLENDDQTRLQMASSQMRQAIMLTSFDPALIQSGCENLYSQYTQFVKRARKNGEVVFRDSRKLIVIYNDKDFDVIKIGVKSIYVENLDSVNVCVNVGDKVKKGDILAESDFCKNGKINIGRNLLTAVMVYHGNNYEDGIVISDKLTEELRSVHYMDLSFNLTPDKVLLSLYEDKFEPLPNPPIQNFIENKGIKPDQDGPKYIYIPKSQPYAIMKKMPSGPIDYYTIFEEDIKLIPKKDVLVYETNIYPNTWNTSIPQFKRWVEETIQKQQDRERKVQDTLLQYLPKPVASQYIKDHNLDKFSNVGKYKIKGDPINGIHVEMNAIFLRLIQVGDKIGNRHGNKGVVSKIVPHNLMPRLEDGRNVEVCINPLGIITRMNIGQLFELELSMSLKDLKNNMVIMLKDKVSQPEIKKYLINYMKIIDNTKDSWYLKQFEKQIPKKITEEFINSLFLIQPPFESTKVENILEALKYSGTEETYKLFDPVLKEDILNKITVGYMYFFRMIHIAESKIAARGIGSYARRTLQPLGGRKNRGGQRCGEMETACLIAHSGLKNLFEFLTTKSDCIDLKNEYIRKEIESDFLKEKKENISIEPESVKLLNSYLTVLGIEK